MNHVKLKKFLKSEYSNNKGFSMVELVIAITILVVVGLTCAMLMSTGSDLFSKTNSREQNQYRTQLALSQIKEFCASSVGIATEENELWLVCRDDSGNDKLYGFVYTPSNKGYKQNKIVLKEAEYSVAGTTVSIPKYGTEIIEQPLINGVKDFDVQVNYTSTNLAESVNIKLTVTNDVKTYTKTYTVALRTKPEYIEQTGGTDTYIYETLAKKIDAKKAGETA